MGEGKSPPQFLAVVLPWLLAAVLSAVYLLTLNPWVAPESLDLVAHVSGLSPRLELFGPVTYLVTWPVRWLPLAWIPPALNLFSAACAVLSLACLARSVVLLPHDRTDEQRLRLQEESPFLTLRSAWLPPALAVLVCGLQLTFWEHAIAATGEMFNLLLFACLVLALLELRATEKPAWLLRFSLLYGLAVANNCAMAAFAPLLFLAAIWAARANPLRRSVLERALKRYNQPKLSLFARCLQALRPFNPGLWLASLGCFLAGLSLLILLPLLASSADNAQLDFWPALRFTLRFYKRLRLALPLSTLSLLCLGSVLPALLMTIRWGRRVGGAMATDRLVTALFHGFHAFLLIVCLWTMLDLPLSPRRLGAGFPFLPLYYLAALSAGYYSGYFLLVFGVGAPPRNHRRRTRLRTPALEVALTSAAGLILLGVTGLLLRQGLPHILWTRTGALAHYADQLERCLPPPGAVIVGDGSSDLLCLQTTLIRHGQQRAYLPVDVSSLARDPTYFDFLQLGHPEFKLMPPALHLASDLTNPPVLLDWFENLAATREIHYLRPPVGGLGESFSFQPRGLFYRLKPCSSNVLEQAPLPPEVLAENRAFWQAFIAKPLPELVRHIPSPEQLARTRAMPWLRLQSDRGIELDPSAEVVAAFYSRALNAWGVELQRAGLLSEAAGSFAAALQLSPENIAAKINREYNQSLQGHKAAAGPASQDSEIQLGKRRSWGQVLTLDGPVDEPKACGAAGGMLAEAHLPRQAAQQFARAHALAPGQADVALRLAEQLVLLADYTNALATANQALQLKPLDPDALFWKSCSLLALQGYEAAFPLLTNSPTIRTNSQHALILGSLHAQLGNLDAARQAYELAARSPASAAQAYFRLAQLAYRRQDSSAAIKYLELCRSNNAPNLVDSGMVDYFLTGLRGPAAGARKP
jgi:tetratricopeptide (TPR) repeat protein